MKPVHILAILGAFLAGTVLGAGWGTPRNGAVALPTDPEMRSGAAELAGLLRSMEARLVSIEEQMAGRTAVRSGATSTNRSSDHERAAVPGNPADPDESSKRRARHREQLDRTMADQPDDAAHTRAFATTVDATLEALASLETERLDVACSVAYCRLVVRHANADNQVAFAESLQGRRGFNEAGIAHLESDGTTYLYLTRETVEPAGELGVGPRDH